MKPILWPRAPIAALDAGRLSERLRAVRAGCRVTLADGRVVRPTLKTAMLIIRHANGPFAAIPLVVCEGSYAAAATTTRQDRS